MNHDRASYAGIAAGCTLSGARALHELACEENRDEQQDSRGYPACLLNMIHESSTNFFQMQPPQGTERLANDPY
ncbi:MAG TPA: hypothetical protein VMV59_10310 [Candidatus Dormibacteraeota bacterium]|nr:hypothetical protein [Candidatus Dormibacteraeota bacterium]